MLELNKMTFCLTHVLLLLSDYIYDRDTPIEDTPFACGRSVLIRKRRYKTPIAFGTSVLRKSVPGKII